MKFQDVCSDLRLGMLLEEEEASVRFVRRQWPEVTDKQLALLSKADPTPGKSHVPWLAKLLKAGRIRLPEDAARSKRVLRRLEDLKTQRVITGEPANISRHQSLGDVEDLLALYKGRQSKESAWRAGEAVGEEQVIDDPPYSVLKIATPEVAAKLCRGTQYCVKDPRWSKSYLARGALYLVLKDGERVALLHGPTGSAKDPSDRDLQPAQQEELAPLAWRLFGKPEDTEVSSGVLGAMIARHPSATRDDAKKLGSHAMHWWLTTHTTTADDIRELSDSALSDAAREAYGKPIAQRLWSEVEQRAIKDPMHWAKIIGFYGITDGPLYSALLQADSYWHAAQYLAGLAEGGHASGESQRRAIRRMLEKLDWSLMPVDELRELKIKPEEVLTVDDVRKHPDADIVKWLAEHGAWSMLETLAGKWIEMEDPDNDARYKGVVGLIAKLMHDAGRTREAQTIARQLAEHPEDSLEHIHRIVDGPEAIHPHALFAVRKGLSSLIKDLHKAPAKHAARWLDYEPLKIAALQHGGGEAGDYLGLWLRSGRPVSALATDHLLAAMVMHAYPDWTMYLRTRLTPEGEGLLLKTHAGQRKWYVERMAKLGIDISDFLQAANDPALKKEYLDAGGRLSKSDVESLADRRMDPSEVLSMPQFVGKVLPQLEERIVRSASRAVLLRYAKTVARNGTQDDIRRFRQLVEKQMDPKGFVSSRHREALRSALGVLKEG